MGRAAGETVNHLLLVLASIALIGVIAAQDYLYAPLRQESISAGLTGPYHWWLDASYVLLAVGLVWRGYGGSWLTEALATIAGISLLCTAATNTFAGFVDQLTAGHHALWHSRFTTAVFVSALALQLSADHGAALWALTAANVAIPATMYLLSHNSTYTEKVGVLGICFWLIAWALE